MSTTSTGFLFILLSSLAQLVMTGYYAREALTTPLGTYCRVKCGLAALLYLGVSCLLGWGLFSTETY